MPAPAAAPVRMRHVLHTLVVALCTFLILGTTLAAEAEARSTTYDLDLPAQDLNAALQAVALATQHKLLYRSDLVEGKVSPALKGTFTTRQALEALLASSDLTFEITPSAVVLIRARNAGPPSNTTLTDSAPFGALSAAASLRVAQVQSPTQAPASSLPETQQDSVVANQKHAVLGEVLVTGTHIADSVPVGTPVITIDRHEINRFGFTTVQDVVRALPQNFGGGASEDTFVGDASGNLYEGTALNLRGIGSGYTLVLINGRRVPAGIGGSHSVDVSTIPLVAVERIEVLTDGASATYGSDAVGGVVNFILRDDFDGAETTLEYGSVTDGGADRARLTQTYGTAWEKGSFFTAYEYNQRSAIAARDRPQALDDLRPLGGPLNFFAQLASPGNIGTTPFVTLYAIPPGQDGRSVTQADLLPPSASNVTDRQLNGEWSPEQTLHGLYLTAHHDVTPRLRVFGDVRLSEREFDSDTGGQINLLTVPTTNAFRNDILPGQTLFISYNHLNDLGVVTLEGDTQVYTVAAGAEYQPASAWRLSALAGYGWERGRFTESNIPRQPELDRRLASSDRNVAFNPFGERDANSADVIEAIRAQGHFENETSLALASLLANVSVMELPAGEAALALGVDYRTEQLRGFNIAGGIERPRLDNPPLDRDVIAYYAEVRVPVFGGTSAPTGLRQLDLSAAVRREDYTDSVPFGTAARRTVERGSTVPKFGITWRPLSDLALRATYGESFRAPTLGGLNEANRRVALAIGFADQGSPTGRSNSLQLTGGNAALEPETADVFTAGLSWSPQAASGLAIEATYFDFQFEDRIRAFSAREILNNPGRFGPLITRSPDRPQVDALCNDPSFFGSRPLCLATPVDVIVDARQNNLGVANISGVDLSVADETATSLGVFGLSLRGSYFLQYEQALSPASPLISTLNTTGNPVDFRGRATASWSRGGWLAAAAVDYTDDYTNNTVTPFTHVPSYTTVDLHLAYTFGGDGLQLALDVNNLADKSPPFLVNARAGAGYDQENADLTGRIISLRLSNSW